MKTIIGLVSGDTYDFQVIGFGTRMTELSINTVKAQIFMSKALLISHFIVMHVNSFPTKTEIGNR